jgi:hypothetical protein
VGEYKVRVYLNAITWSIIIAKPLKSLDIQWHLQALNPIHIYEHYWPSQISVIKKKHFPSSKIYCVQARFLLLLLLLLLLELLEEREHPSSPSGAQYVTLHKNIFLTSKF